MAIERDEANERLARIDLLLNEAKRTMAHVRKTDRQLAQRLADQLDDMLREVLGPVEARRLRA